MRVNNFLCTLQLASFPSCSYFLNIAVDFVYFVACLLFGLLPCAVHRRCHEMFYLLILRIHRDLLLSFNNRVLPKDANIGNIVLLSMLNIPSFENILNGGFFKYFIMFIWNDSITISTYAFSSQ